MSAGAAVGRYSDLQDVAGRSVPLGAVDEARPADAGGQSPDLRLNVGAQTTHILPPNRPLTPGDRALQFSFSSGLAAVHAWVTYGAVAGLRASSEKQPSNDLLALMQFMGLGFTACAGIAATGYMAVDALAAAFNIKALRMVEPPVRQANNGEQEPGQLVDRKSDVIFAVTMSLLAAATPAGIYFTEVKGVKPWLARLKHSDHSSSGDIRRELIQINAATAQVSPAEHLAHLTVPAPASWQVIEPRQTPKASPEPASKT
jgi:hypothetical protein